MLHFVEVAVANNAWQINRYIDRPDSMYSVVHRLQEDNPVIMGSAIAFEPNYYPDKRRFFSPYAYRQDSSIVTKQLGTDNYEYHYMDWYQIPKLLDRPYWSEPYFDSGGGEFIIDNLFLAVA